MNIVYMGTPEFAVPPLLALIGEHNVTAVVTQPDKQKGRGYKAVFEPVKETALKYNIPLLQPERSKKKSFINELSQYPADIYVVAAYGQIVSETLLNIPRFGAINIHGSLLPKYRGASPIHQAVINGDDMTGITIIQMDKGIDTGDMILKREIEILASDTTGTLHDKLSVLGAEAVLEALSLIENGTVRYEKQDGALSSYAPMIQKGFGLINWNSPAVCIANLVRGLNPWPSAYTYMGNGVMLKIWAAEVLTIESVAGRCGEILSIERNGIVVAASEGALLITEIQSAGGKRMKAADFLRGHKLSVGSVFRQ